MMSVFWSATKRPGPRRVLLALEALEDRWVPAVILSLNGVTRVNSCAGVGFTKNEVASLDGNVDGQRVTDPSAFSTQINWGDGQTIAGFVTRDIGGSGDFIVKGDHVYSQPGT